MQSVRGSKNKASTVSEPPAQEHDSLLGASRSPPSHQSAPVGSIQTPMTTHARHHHMPRQASTQSNHEVGASTSNFAPLPRDALLENDNSNQSYVASLCHSIFDHAQSFILVYVVLAGTVAGTFAFYFEAPDLHWTGTSAVAWFLFLSIALACIPLSSIFSWLILGLIELCTPKSRSSYRFLLVLHGVHPAAAYLTWAIAVMVAYFTILLSNPAPATDSQGRPHRTDIEDLWWLTRLLGLNIALGILLVLRLAAIKKISFGQRTQTYVPLVKESCEHEEIIARLTFDVPPSNLSRHYKRPSPESRYRLSEEAAVKLQARFRKHLRHKAAEVASVGSDDKSSEKTNDPNEKQHSKRQTKVESGSFATRLGHMASSSSGLPTNEELEDMFSHPSAHVEAEIGDRLGDNANVLRQPLPHHMPKPSIPADQRLEEIDAALLLDFEHVRAHHLHACKGNRQITNKAEAERLAIALFDRYEVGGRVQYSTLERIVKMFPSQHPNAVSNRFRQDRTEDADVARRTNQSAYQRVGEDAEDRLSPQSVDESSNDVEQQLQERLKTMFDPNDVGSIDEAFMIDCCTKAFAARKHVSLTLRDLDSIVDALGSFFSAALAIVMLFMLNIVFSTGDLAELTVTVGTTLFALSFIFADSAKNVFNSFMFLFVRHPYDIGDRVILSGLNLTDHCFVARLELMTTTFRIWDGSVLTVPNHVLYGVHIVNLMRPTTMTDKLFFWIDYRTPVQKYEEFEQRFFEFLKTRPNDFDPLNCAVFIRDFADANAMLLGVFTAQRSNWQNGEHVPRKHAVILAVKAILEDLDIRYYPPTQKVQIAHQEQGGF